MRWSALLAGLCLIGLGGAAGPAAAAAGARVTPIKDPNGKTLALILDCEACGARASKGKSGAKDGGCETGVEDGYLEGKRCGKCLLDANYGKRIAYPYDLYIQGYLKDEHGKPLEKKFVRLFLPNSWTVRTRTGKNGFFRILLGATAPRKGKPLVVDLGTRTRRQDSKAELYALYMMPVEYRSCEAFEAEEKATPVP